MVTIKEIAKQANVSIATVSKIINGLDNHISDKTISRVKKIIKECNYVPNSVARGLKTKVTNSLGFILPDIANPYYSEIARGIEDAAIAKDFSVIFCDTDDTLKNENRSINLLKSKMVDGIIFSRVLENNRENDDGNKVGSNIPVVIVDRVVNEMIPDNYGRVFVDVKKTIYHSTIKLSEAGCKKIAIISKKWNNKNNRYYGFIDALKDAGLKHVKAREYLGGFDINTGYTGIKKILEAGTKVDGVVCGNDLIAIGVLDYLNEMKIKVPDKIRIIGLDNIYFANYTNPKLSTMEQPTYEMGKAAANMLIDYIKEAVPMSTRIFDHKYIERETI